MQTNVEPLIKLRIIVIMDMLIDNVFTEIQIVLRTDSLTIKREVLLTLYFPFVGFISLELLNSRLIDKCRFRTHGMLGYILLHS